MKPAQKEILEILKVEFDRARTRNPAFSLRSLAKRTGIHPSALSRILSGKHPITRKSAEKILTYANLPAETAQKLLGQLKYRRNPIELSADSTAPTPHEFLEQTRVLTEWQHFAILGLIRTRGFKSNPKWMAARLGLSVSKITAAIDTLIQLKFIRKVSDSKYQILEPKTNFQAPLSVAAVNRFHREGLDQAIDWLSSAQNPKEGGCQGILLPSSPEQFQKIRPLISEMAWKLCQALEGGKPTEVYRINLQVFPVSRPAEN